MRRAAPARRCRPCGDDLRQGLVRHARVAARRHDRGGPAPELGARWAKHALARTDAQTYIAHPHGHLVLLRHGRTLWRSRAAHGSDDVALDGDAIAFTAYRRRHPNPDLWLARVGKEERLVARN